MFGSTLAALLLVLANLMTNRAMANAKETYACGPDGRTGQKRIPRDHEP